MQKFKTLSDYIANQPIDMQAKLQELRQFIKQLIPNSQEVISYGMPAFKGHKVLVYFALFKNHIGFYPTSSGIKFIESKLSHLSYSKGAIQFPLHEPLPYELIEEIILYRKDEDDKLAKTKKP